MKLSFYGAAQTVTGSCYMVSTKLTKVLIDCGMFQGGKELEALNFKEFPFDPCEINAMILTHSHIDHSGRIPKLVKDGYRGDIYTTKAASDLCSIMLPDSAHIQESETEWKNRKRTRAGLELLEPLYTQDDAEDSLRLFKPVLYNQTIEISEDITIRFRDAGHVLGSAIVEIWVKEGQRVTKLVFSGDLGRKDKPLLRDPYIIEDADYLILEGTYGNRNHDDKGDRIDKLLDIIDETIRRGGNVVIPSFAVGRTQEIVYELNKFKERLDAKKLERFKSTKVYIDSPLAASATEIFRKNSDCFDEEALDYILNGDNPLDFENLEIVRSVEKSKLLNESNESKVVISASGMCEAGRIKHHLKHNLWRKESSIVFVGYQAQGTLGRMIKDGNTKVKIFGEDIEVKAHIHSIEGFSGHAGKDELIEWLSGFTKMPKKILLVHGEPESLEALGDEIQQRFNIQVYTPNIGDCFDIMGDNTVFEASNTAQITSNVSKKIDELKYQLHNTFQRLEKAYEEEAPSPELSKLENLLVEIDRSIIELNRHLNDINSSKGKVKE